MLSSVGSVRAAAGTALVASADDSHFDAVAVIGLTGVLDISLLESNGPTSGLRSGVKPIIPIHSLSTGVSGMRGAGTDVGLVVDVLVLLALVVAAGWVVDAEVGAAVEEVVSAGVLGTT